MTEIEEIENGLKPLFETAKKEGLWFNCHYQDLWFSPKELEELQADGRFLWGAVNWKLRDPKEHLEYLKNKVKSAEIEVKKIELKMAEN